MAIFLSTCVTTGSTQGFPSSVLNAPTPRLTFLGLGSFSQSDFSLKTATGGACSTRKNVEGASGSSFMPAAVSASDISVILACLLGGLLGSQGMWMFWPEAGKLLLKKGVAK